MSRALFTYADGEEYRGDWVDGKKQGLGELNTPNGIKYTGGFESGYFNGFGVLSFPDGSRMEAYEESLITATCSPGPTNKDCYKFSYLPRTIREWNNLPEAIVNINDNEKFQAALKAHLAAMYEGQFSVGKFDGFGVFKGAQGMIFEGEFIQGRVSGKGLITFPNGEHGLPRREGIFDGTQLVQRIRCPEEVEKARHAAQNAVSITVD